MSGSRLLKAVSILMIAIFPAATFAAENNALLLPDGNVTVNGTQVSRSTAIFAGDHIQTGAKSQVSMTLAGSTVQVGADSQVLFEKSGIALPGTGAATVTTTSGMQGHIRNLSITPATNSSTKYEFGVRGNSVIVASLKGSVRVNDGKQEMMLNAGNAVSFADPEPQKSGGATPGASTGTGIAISNGVALAIAGAAAALGVGLGLGLTQAITPPASPTR